MASRADMVVIREVTAEARGVMAEARDARVTTTTTTRGAERAGMLEETLLREAGTTTPISQSSYRHLLTMDSYGGGGGYGGGDNDFSGAMQHAEEHGGDSGDSSMFSNVLNRLGQNHQEIGNQGIDEQRTPSPNYPSFSHKILS